MMDIVFKESILKDIADGVYIVNCDVNTVKGLYVNNSVKINISALQWYISYILNGVEDFIEEFSNTATHECIHHLIRHTKVDDSYTIDGEEKVCRLMADQSEDCAVS
jgi:hypothetical protein